MSDMLRTLAFAFRRKGADQMAGTELRYLLAFDLRWFAPEDAKKVVVRALAAGLLAEEGDSVRPAFDITTIQIPLNFRPTNHVLEEELPTDLPPFVSTARPHSPPAAPMPSAAPAALATHAVVPSDAERASEEERRKRGLLVSLEVARLIVRRRTGEDVSENAALLEAALLSASAPSRS